MFKNKLLSHFQIIKQIIETLELPLSSLQLNCHSFILSLKLLDKTYSFYPQFLEITTNKKYGYSANLSENSHLFSGWRPYTSIEIPLFSDKLAIKKALQHRSILTPDFLSTNSIEMSDIVIKQRHGSFSKNIKGPFKSNQQQTAGKENTEFYEKFIIGNIVKLWYWNEVFICLEIQPMPTVTGDGKKTIRELLHEQQLTRRNKGIDWPAIEMVLNYYQLAPNSILPYGKKQLVDFRYNSSVSKTFSTQDKTLRDNDLINLGETLGKYGSVLYELSNKKNFAYSVDAILDKENKLWFLEVNTNPFIHPLIYPEMFRTLLFHN